MKNKPINILLATYNGQKYLADLLDSIILQTHTCFKILIRDDCSSDSTPEILQRYQIKYPDKILIFDALGTNLGVIKNFEFLLQKSTSNYIMFADQDDVWLPCKIEKTFSKMLELEESSSKSTFVLVHTDLKITDQHLNVISNSMFKYQGLNFNYKTVNKLLVQNNVTGCTIMINKALKDAALPFPSKILMHDWLFALLAADKGKIGFVDEATILYRQHTANSVGSKGYGVKYIYRQLMSIFDKKSVVNSMVQAQNIVDNKNINNKEIFEKFANLYKFNWFYRKYLILKYGFLKSRVLRNIGLFIKI